MNLKNPLKMKLKSPPGAFTNSLVCLHLSCLPRIVSNKFSLKCATVSCTWSQTARNEIISDATQTFSHINRVLFGVEWNEMNMFRSLSNCRFDCILLTTTTLWLHTESHICLKCKRDALSNELRELQNPFNENWNASNHTLEIRKRWRCDIRIEFWTTERISHFRHPHYYATFKSREA